MVLGLLARERPDVVVCTYPVANEVLGRLRRRGLVAVPLVSAITDLAALRYWAHPGCDLHLVIHPESAAEIRAIAGPDARVEAVRGLTRAAFDTPRDPAAAAGQRTTSSARAAAEPEASAAGEVRGS